MPARKKVLLRRKTRSSARSGFSQKISQLFVFVLLGLVAFLVYKLYCSWKESKWNGNSRITVVVASENPTIYSYSPDNQSLITVTVPKDTQLESAMGYGSWLAGSLWGLGEQEGKDGEILRNTMQKSLGVPVDAWASPEGATLFEQGKLGYFSALIAAVQTGTLETDLTFFDRWRLVMAVGGVGKLSRQEVDLEKVGVIDRTKLPDGMEGYVVIPEKIVAGVGLLRDDGVFEEARTLKITNASSRSGLASQISRTVSVLGLRVLTTDNAKEKIDGICKVRGNESNLESESAKRLVSLFGCEREIAQDVGAANLEMMIGEEFKKIY